MSLLKIIQELHLYTLSKMLNFLSSTKYLDNHIPIFLPVPGQGLCHNPELCSVDELLL